MELSTPALLFPAIAILTLGYINRYIGIANVIRTFAKDYYTGHEHVALTKQLKILKKRIEITRFMLTFAAIALILACASMLFIFLGDIGIGELFFGFSLACMILSLVASLSETFLSNRSLIIEIDDILDKETS
ncbi:MAG: hypothetical protein QG628_1002 [Patescibacteria group bacterium]|jgi:hypothetical protein|nr:hypothetical protein [Patescibacteria group bacterium]